MSNEDDNLPWDVKSLILILGGDETDKNTIRFEILDDTQFNIYEGGPEEEAPKWFYENIHIDAARRLRDFLNYAVPDDES